MGSSILSLRTMERYKGNGIPTSWKDVSDRTSQFESESLRMSKDDKHIDRHFPLTPEGYLDAKKWLVEIGEWDYVSTHGFSVDGWSIIDTANLMWSKRNKTPPSATG
jgi:hypothetical protein